MKCPKCGKQIPAEYKFCPYCKHKWSYGFRDYFCSVKEPVTWQVKPTPSLEPVLPTIRHDWPLVIRPELTQSLFDWLTDRSKAC